MMVVIYVTAYIIESKVSVNFLSFKFDIRFVLKSPSSRSCIIMKFLKCKKETCGLCFKILTRLTLTGTYISCLMHSIFQPGRVAQSVWHLAHKSEVLSSIPGLASTALLESAAGEAKVCGQTGYRTQDP